MRVHAAVDARPLLHPYTGIGRYLQRLAPELSRLGVSLSYMEPRMPRHRALFAANFSYASRARSIDADLFWSPRHHLPFFLKIPSIVTIHDLVWKHKPDTMAFGRSTYDAFLSRRSIRVADHIVCVSRSTARDLLQEFPQAESKLSVIPLAPTLHPADAGSHKRQSDKPYLLFVGTLEPRKNLKRTIAAFTQAKISEEYDLLVVANAGWGSADISSTESVCILNNVKDEVLASLYKHCTFVVAPSLYEGFGLQIAEAHAFGKAVVTSDLSSMPEVCGDAGLLVDPYNVDEIAGAIRELADNSRLRSALEANASRISAQRSWHRVATETLAAFDKAINHE